MPMDAAPPVRTGSGRVAPERVLRTIARHVDGDTDTVGSGLVWREVVCGEADADSEARDLVANPRDDAPQERSAVFEAAAVRSRSVDRAEELVQQVAVAVLHVDEVVSGAGREHGGAAERLDQLVKILVRQHDGGVGPDAAVEDRMVVREARLRRAGRARPASGVCELQPDDEPFGVAVCIRVRFDEFGAQGREVVDGRRVDHELTRIRASVVDHCDRFAAPDELGPALAEASPSPPDQVGDGAVRPAVPSLHRQHREAVGDRARTRGTVGEGERLCERPRAVDGVVDTELVVDLEYGQPGAQIVDRLQVLDLHSALFGARHSNASSRSAISASTAQSVSGRVGTPGGAAFEAMRPRSARNIAASWRYAGTGGRNAKKPRYCSRSLSPWNARSPAAHRRSRSANASGANADNPSR